MIIEERYQKILDLLNEKKVVSYAEMAEALYCSLSTIRRDIAAMAKRGLLEKVHNGAAKVEGSASESPFVVRESENIEAKRRLALKAKDFLTPGCTLFLDSSTTCGQLIPFLRGMPSITVITNGIENALLLAQNGIEVHLPSGVLSPKNNAVIGTSAVEYVSRFSPDLFFLSTRGLSLEGICSEATEATRDIKAMMLKKAKTSILLVDASKIGETYFAETGSLKNIDIIIAESPLPEKLLKAIEESGTKLLYV